MVEKPTWRKAPMQLTTLLPSHRRFFGKSWDTPQQNASHDTPTGKMAALRMYRIGDDCPGRTPKCTKEPCFDSP